MENSKKQYESRHRLTWAARYPLKPGCDVASRRGLLVQLADTAVTGEYWVSQEKLAERMGLGVRGVRKILAKLCAEGVLRARPRGYKQTTIYTLMRLDEVSRHGDFPTLDLSDRNHSSSQAPPPFDRNHRASRIGLTGTTVPLATGTTGPPKEAIVQEDIKKEAAAAAVVPSSRARAREAHENQPAAAAADFDSDSSTNTDKRHTCPKCEKTWPKRFGAVCFTCQCDVERAKRQQELHAEMLEDVRLFDEAHPPPPPKPPVSTTARRMCQAAQTALPASWLYRQDLKTLLVGHDFKEVCETIGGINIHELPEPGAFFKDYSQHRERYLKVEAEIKSSLEDMADPRRKSMAA